MKRTYKALQKAAPEQVKLVIAVDTIRVTLPNDLIFDYKQAVVKKEYFPSLDRLAQVFRKFDETSLLIVGYTDAIGGDSPANLDLSKRRADSVRDVLVVQQIKANRLTTAGRSSQQPIASNETEEGRALNRRVEFIVHRVKEQ